MTSKTLAEQLASKLGRKLEKPEEAEPGLALNGQVIEDSKFGGEEPERNKLSEESIVLVKIPKTAKVVRAERFDGMYIQFSVRVGSGFVNFHVHVKEKPKSIVGTEVVAECEVWEKVFKNGRRFIYLDFHPIDVPVTHSLHITSKPQLTEAEENLVFKLQRPLKDNLVLKPV